MNVVPTVHMETFPPRASWWPSLLTAALVLAIGSGVWWTWHDAPPLLAGVLHPLAWVGHALTAAAVLGLLLGAIRLSRWQSALSRFPSQNQDTLLDQAWQRCMQLLPAPTDEVHQANGVKPTDPLHRICADWESHLTRSCWQLFGLAMVPFLLGLVLSLPRSAQLLQSGSGLAERMIPLAVGSLETTLIGAWACWQALSWASLVQHVREKFKWQHDRTVAKLADWENRLKKKEQELNERDVESPRRDRPTRNDFARNSVPEQSDTMEEIKENIPIIIDRMDPPDY